MRLSRRSEWEARTGLVAVMIAIAGAGCSAVSRGHSEAACGEKKRDRPIGWRLVERTYGFVDEPWSGAGDGAIPREATTLVFEPIPAEEKSYVPGLVTGRSECAHSIRVEYDGPASRNVGERVEVTVSMDDPGAADHVVEFSGSHAGIAILSVSGAEAVKEAPGRYVLRARAKAVVAFTSRMEGRGWLRVRVVREIAEGDGR